MGRKRLLVVKDRVVLSVDKDIKAKLQEYGINMSALFNEAAIEKIKELESKKLDR